MMKKDDKISHSELVSLVGIQVKKIDELTSINEELIVEKETLNSSNKELISLNEKLKGDNERLSLLLAMGKARTFGNK